MTTEDQNKKERMPMIEDKLMQLNIDMLEKGLDLVNLDKKFNEEIEVKIDTLTNKFSYVILSE